MDSKTELVFVYGTLRRGGSNAFRMDGAEFVGRGEVAGRLVAVSWYPGLVPGAPGEWVTGDVFEVIPEHLRKLDEYEGLAAGEVEGCEYRRVRVKVYAAGQQGSLGEAWVWQWTGPVDEARIIRSGDWMDVEQPRPAPWFTAIATCCLLGMPLAFVFAIVAGLTDTPANRKAIEFIMRGLQISPVATLLIAWMGGRRRERWRSLRWLILAVSACLALLVLLDVLLRLVGT